jgi:hypothetical protein
MVFTAVARRIGELVPPTPPEIKGKRAHGKELSEVRTTDFPEKQPLSEFRKLAKIPEPVAVLLVIPTFLQ